MNTPDVQTVPEPLTIDGSEPSVLPWAHARQRINDARYYWLGTVHPNGRPHARASARRMGRWRALHDLKPAGQKRAESQP
jgi:hypothetical protein